MTSQIPTLLQPYLKSPAKGSLTVLSSVLGATANWLVVRYLYVLLGSNKIPQYVPSHEPLTNIAAPELGDVKVIFVSFMRDWNFWMSEARRTVGLDLAKLKQQERLVFVDGLSSLYMPNLSLQGVFSSDTRSQSTSPRIIPERGLLPSKTTSIPVRYPVPPDNTQRRDSKGFQITSSSCDAVIESIKSALESINSGEDSQPIVLIFDSPSILLQTSSPPITASEVSSLLMYLRSIFHATIVTLPADTALTQADTGMQTPLEADNAAFTIGLAHQADLAISCRSLGTGWAGDVSGVLRITRGAQCDSIASHNDANSEIPDEGEWLYHISGDGSAKVWIRA